MSEPIQRDESQADERGLIRDQHYVPRVYLKNFESCAGHLYAYRVLVAHPKTHLWRRCTLSGLAYHQHLYTRDLRGVGSDEMERWFSQNIEDPAEEAISKVLREAPLTKLDWNVLARFVAAQDVRTPARLSENLIRWKTMVPEVMDRVSEEIPEKLRQITRGSEEGGYENPSVTAYRGYIPLRVKRHVLKDEDKIGVSLEMVAGRGLWLYSMRHLLSDSVNILPSHRWTILHAPDDLKWFTSDDPVLKFNWYGNYNYDFNGGWLSQGTEIMLPLSPTHLLYAQVGRKPPMRGTVLSRERAIVIRRAIAQHAFRTVIATSVDQDVLAFRPRVVDAVAVKYEADHWEKWREEQDIAERQLSEATE